MLAMVDIYRPLACCMRANCLCLLGSRNRRRCRTSVLRQSSEKQRRPGNSAGRSTGSILWHRKGLEWSGQTVERRRWILGWNGNWRVTAGRVVEKTRIWFTRRRIDPVETAALRRDVELRFSWRRRDSPAQTRVAAGKRANGRAQGNARKPGDRR